MKIGKIDVTVPMLAYTAGFVAAIIVLVAMWKRNSDLRYEAICRRSVYRAMYDDGGEAIAKGIESCQGLVAAYPGKLNARLYLANIQFRQKTYHEAQKTFEEAANSAKATPREKGWAYTGAGVSLFMAAPKTGQAKAAADAEAFFKKALEADKNCVDAMINMGLVAMHKGGDDAVDKADVWCKQALDCQAPADGKSGGAVVPSIKAQEQLYVLKALVSAKRGQNSEAVSYFDRVKAMRQASTTGEANKRMAMLASVTEKELETSARKELLTKLEAELSKFGKDNISAYNALGIGYSLLKGEPDYATVALASAVRHLTKATETDPKDPRAYYNLAAIYQKRMVDLAAKLSSPITGLTGETAALNRWLSGDKVARFTPVERNIVNDLKKLLTDEENLWKKYQDKGKLENPARIDCKLRQLVCVRRQLYLLESEEIGSSNPLLLRANNLVKDLETLAPDNPVVSAAIGYFNLDKGDYLGAHKQFLKAAEKGDKSPEVERMIKGLGLKPEVGDVRPGKRYYGPRPLIGGTLKAISAGGVPKQAVMKIDDQPVQAALGGPLGLQILYYPAEKDLKDGEHTVSITMADSMGQQVEFTPFTFSLDKVPPKLNLQPDLSVPLPNRPVFTATLEDRSGIDFSTLKITMRLSSGKGQVMQLIADGRVKRAMTETNPARKIGFPIDNEKFQFGAGQDLQPGAYELTLVVSDMAGNVMTEIKKFSVAK